MQYIKWLHTFNSEFSEKNLVNRFFAALLNASTEMISTLALFIPLKALMILGNPELIKNIPIIGTMSLHDLTNLLVVLFLALISISIISKFLAEKINKSIQKKLWEGFNNKTAVIKTAAQHKNAYTRLSRVHSALLIILMCGLAIFLLDMYIGATLILTFSLFIVFFSRLIKYNPKERQDNVLLTPHLLLQFIMNIGFVIVFLAIIVEYMLLNEAMNIIYALLALLLSRVVLRAGYNLFLENIHVHDLFYTKHLKQ